MSNSDKVSVGNGRISGACGCTVVALVLNILFGGWSVSYLLNFWLGQHIPFWVDCVIGLFVGQFTIPAAIITFLLSLSGVHTPWAP